MTTKEMIKELNGLGFKYDDRDWRDTDPFVYITKMGYNRKKEVWFYSMTTPTSRGFMLRFTDGKFYRWMPMDRYWDWQKIEPIDIPSMILLYGNA